MPITGVSHLGLCVRDLEASLHFYCEVLGFDRVAYMTGIDDPEVGRLLELDDLSMELAFVERDGFRVELIHLRNPTPSGGGKGAFHRVGFTHLSVKGADFDAELDRLRALGVPLLENTIGPAPARTRASPSSSIRTGTGSSSSARSTRASGSRGSSVEDRCFRPPDAAWLLRQFGRVRRRARPALSGAAAA